MSASRRVSALFEARATKERVLHLRECAEYSFSHRILCLICRIPFVNRMALVHAIAKVSIAIYFHSFINLLHIIKSNYFQNAQKGG
jgi:hypothetical protein